MKRRILTLLLAAAVLWGVLPGSAEAAQDQKVLRTQKLVTDELTTNGTCYYDAQGRCIREEWLGGFTYIKRVLETTYTEEGLPVTREAWDDGVLTQVTEYDSFGNPVTLWSVDSQGERTAAVSYDNQYDSQGRLTARNWQEEDLKIRETYTYHPDKTCADLVTGDLVRFGSFLQEGREPEPITWIVLEAREDRLLVVSRYALDSLPYHDREGAVTWETSSLRQWLNGEFFETAFTEPEKTAITTAAQAEGEDPVTLLQLDQAEHYFPTNFSRICRATEYAVKRNAYVNQDTGGSWWWLRDMGDTDRKALSILSDGRTDRAGDRAYGYRGVVRPALWIQGDAAEIVGSETPAVDTYTRQEQTGTQTVRSLKEQYDVRGNLTFRQEETEDLSYTDTYENTYEANGLLTAARVNRQSRKRLEDGTVVKEQYRPFRLYGYTYDPAGRLVRMDQDNKTPGEVNLWETWTYDEDGNLLKWNTPWSGHNTYTYTALSNALWEP